MFCSQCGNKLDPQSDFCSECGLSVVAKDQSVESAEPSVEQIEQPTQSPMERVLWVLRAQRKFSMFKLMPCNIVFMKDKIVLAYLTPELQKIESARASGEIKEKELGFFKSSLEMMNIWSKFSERYNTMGVEEILSEDPMNVVINKEDITKILFKASRSRL